MPWVMCKRDRPGLFHRSVRDPKTNAILRTLEFPPGQPVFVTDEELPAIRKDLTKALRFVSLDAKGRPTVVDSADLAISHVPVEETGPDAGNELTPLEDLPDDELLRLAEEEKLELAPDADRAAIIAALRLAGIDGVEVGPPIDLEKLTVEELKKLAAEQNFDVTGCKKKADFIRVITAANAAAP